MNEKEMLMFNVGDAICYCDANSENKAIFQGFVLEVKEQIKISYHDTSGQKVIWVDAGDLESRDTSRCSNNDECGWCDDTGKCIYE